MTLQLEKGMEIGRTQLLADLVALTIWPMIWLLQGDFRVRGDTIDVFPAHYEDRAWRIELFGDEIDSLTEFDPLTGQKSGDLEKSALCQFTLCDTRPDLEQAMVGGKDELKTRLEKFEAAGRLLEAQSWNNAPISIWKCWKPPALAPVLKIIRYLTGRKPGEPPPTV